MTNAVDVIKKHLQVKSTNWDLIGVISTSGQVYSFGSDSKIIGRLFEILIREVLTDAAYELGYMLYESPKQTIYPDFWFEKKGKKRIAIDVKSTYRKFSGTGDMHKFGFTLGSYASFLRNGTKNIDGKYSDYNQHIVVGFLYSRVSSSSFNVSSPNSSKHILPPYKDVEVFVQEKYKISGDRPGSGNTENIGTITSNNIQHFSNGVGPFSFLGNDHFERYWRSYPKYREPRLTYSNLDEYVDWITQSDGPDRALNLHYQEWLSFKATMFV